MNLRRFARYAALSALGLLLTGRAAGDSLNLRLAGEWPFSGTMAVLGVPSRGLVFYGSGGGVYVLDATDLTEPRQISDAIRTHGIVCALAYDSTAKLLYVAAQQAGLEIWDVADSTQPLFLGACRTPWFPAAVTVVNACAYVADRDSGLRIIDVSNPAAPCEVGRYLAPNAVLDVAVSNRLAYITDEVAVRVIDVVNPHCPYELGRWDDTLNWAFAVEVRGSYAYVADGGRGLVVLNVSSPSTPFEVGSCQSVVEARDVALKDDYAYIADDWFGVVVMDISDPSNPAQVGNAGSGGKRSVDVADTFLYTMGDWLHVFGLGDRRHPEELGYYHPPMMSGSCAISGGYAFAGTDIGLIVVSVSDLTEMHEVGSCTAGATDIALRGHYVYAPCSYGFGVVDVSDPLSPSRVGFCMLGDISEGVALGDSVAVVAAQNSVRIVDISDPTSPTVIGVYDSVFQAQAIAVRDSLAFVMQGVRGLVVLDISDPCRPVRVGQVVPALFHYDIALLGDYAYVAAADSGLVIVDVTDPASPRVAGCYTAGRADFVLAQGKYIYIAGRQSQTGQVPLVMLDVTDPLSPVEVAQCDDGGIPCVADGSLLYVERYGLHVYEQSGYGLEERSGGYTRGPAARMLSTFSLGEDVAVDFFTPSETVMDFRLYDIAGKRIAQLPHARYERGQHRVFLSARGLALGAYFVKSTPPMNGAGKVVICK